MANYKELVPFILKWEGGFVNDPADAGGATNRGVTLGTWRTYCRRKGREASVETLKAMTDAEWEEIFKTMYWDRAEADRIKDQSVANIFTDWLWMSGTYAIKHVQRIVGVTADGIVGYRTLAAINAFAAVPLFLRIREDRIEFVNAIVRRRPSQRRFLKGWMNRINSIQPFGKLIF